ncbi:MAG TPA: hypothetical protein VF771_21425 [Longimicrobiaceae bacterium]
MSAHARELLDEFERHGWTDGTYPAFHALVQDHPGELPALLEMAIGRALRRTNFVGEAVSYTPEPDLEPLVNRALDALARDGGNAAAQIVIDHVTLQFPRLLHPRLREIFERGETCNGYFDDQPWRESGEADHPRLLSLVRDAGERADDAMQCLLETRTPAAFEAAYRHPELLRVPPEYELRDVGFEPAAGGGWRRLYPEAGSHVRFPDGRPQPPGDPVIHVHHPTWHLDTSGAVSARWGGEGAGACAVCEQPRAHLLTLSPVPAGLGVTGMHTLVLETCLHCVFTSSELEYAHDADGRPAPHRYQMERQEAESTPILHPANVHLVPTPPRWRWQDWGAANGRENLTRLGGHPAWVQGAAYPQCPDCGATMAFLLQLQEDLAGLDGGRAWDEGMIYGFWCDACRVSAFIAQVT